MPRRFSARQGRRLKPKARDVSAQIQAMPEFHRSTESGFRTSESGLRISETRFRTAEAGFRSAESGLRLSETALRRSECGFRAAEFGFRAAEGGFRTRVSAPCPAEVCGREQPVRDRRERTFLPAPASEVGPLRT